jgi:hypothetical protein
MTISTEFKEITPELAQAYLATMGRNRRLKTVKVTALAKAMRAGKFRKTHQGIAFSPAGALIDGQHRLQAIVKSGETIELNVSHGVKEDTLDAVDVGIKRSASDLFEFLGGDKGISSRLMAVARGCMVGITEGSPSYEHQVLVDFGIEHENLMTHFIKMSHRPNLKVCYRAPWVAAFTMAALVHGEDKVTPMLGRMANLNFHGEDDPAKLFFTFLLNSRYEKTLGRRGVRPHYLYGMAASAINLSISGVNKKLLRRTKKDFDGADEIRAPYLMPESTTD